MSALSLSNEYIRFVKCSVARKLAIAVLTLTQLGHIRMSSSEPRNNAEYWIYDRRYSDVVPLEFWSS